MIDRTKRNQLAQALRNLLSGRIDNLAFDDLDGKSLVTITEDRALFEIFYYVWGHYDDFRSHPLDLTDGQRLDFKRCIVFLHSDVEYEWPPRRSRIVDYLRRMADDITGRRYGWWPIKTDGDLGVWPFFRRDDYEEALRSPVLFRGPPEVSKPG